MRSAECGVRGSVERGAWSMTWDSVFRIPHSAFRIVKGRVSQSLLPAQDVVFVGARVGLAADVNHLVRAGGPDHDGRIALKEVRGGWSVNIDQSVVSGGAAVLRYAC